MHPQLNVYLDGSEEPVVVNVISDDFWTYEDIAGSKTSETGMRLTIAYRHLEGKDPKNIAEVRAWAREHAVIVTLGEPADPTRPAPGAG